MGHLKLCKVVVIRTDSGKCKGKLPVSLTKHYAIKTYGGVYVQIHVFLTSALVEGDLSASRPGRFTPGTQWMGGWVGHMTGLGDVENRTCFTSPGLEIRSFGHPARSQSLY
jgi:hypothetical protein